MVAQNTVPWTQDISGPAEYSLLEAVYRPTECKYTGLLINCNWSLLSRWIKYECRCVPVHKIAPYRHMKSGGKFLQILNLGTRRIEVTRIWSSHGVKAVECVVFCDGTTCALVGAYRVFGRIISSVLRAEFG